MSQGKHFWKMGDNLRMPVRAFLVARLLILVSRAAGETFPSLEIKYAATPATWGVAMEVPEMLLVAYKTAKAQYQPCYEHVEHEIRTVLLLPIQEEMTLDPGPKTSTTAP